MLSHRHRDLCNTSEKPLMRVGSLKYSRGRCVVYLPVMPIADLFEGVTFGVMKTECRSSLFTCTDMCHCDVHCASWRSGALAGNRDGKR